MKKITLYTFLFVFLSSCYTDKEEILYPDKDCSIQSNVSYKNELVPILETRCYSCHDASKAKIKGGGIQLDNFEKFNDAVNSFNLLLSIQHKGGVSPMPQNDNKLTTCQISAFETWIFEGQKNN